MKLEATLQEMYSDEYDWYEVFAYAGEPSRCGDALVRPVMGDNRTPLTPFKLCDVEEIFASIIGYGDGPPWRAFGKTRDERFFYLEAECDYTGWD